MSRSVAGHNRCQRGAAARRDDAHRIRVVAKDQKLGTIRIGHNGLGVGTPIMSKFPLERFITSIAPAGTRSFGLKLQRHNDTCGDGSHAVAGPVSWTFLRGSVRVFKLHAVTVSQI